MTENKGKLIRYNTPNHPSTMGGFNDHQDFWGIYKFINNNLDMNVAGTLSNAISNDKKRMVCPANPHADRDGTWQGYMQCAGGTNDYNMTENRLVTVARKWMRFTDGNPAIFADVAVIRDEPIGGIYKSFTNHWNMNGNLPAGGNAVHLDGSVKWYPHSGEANKAGTYVSNGAIFPLQAWPSSVILLKLQADPVTGGPILHGGYVAIDGPNMQVSTNWLYTFRELP